MRTINRIIIHCTATPEGRHIDVATLRKWHVKDRGWKDIGYHYVIYLDGSVHEGRPVALSGAHTTGHNSDSIGVVYVGGTDKDLKAKDTLNEAQEVALVNLIHALRDRFGKLTIHGHNEFANKACPSFKVYEKFEWLL